MVVMSERTLLTSHADSIHLQDLEFEKKLKTLIQKIRVLYHTPETTLSKLSLIISRNQHSSSPTISILQRLNRLFIYDIGLINYITKELASLFPRDQIGQGSNTNGDMSSPSTFRMDPELQTGLTVNNNKAASLGNSDTGSSPNKRDDRDYGTASNGNANIDTKRSNAGERFDGKDIENDVMATLHISDIRSAPIRQRPSTHMTLESESLQGILQHGDPTLAEDIYQHIGQYTTFQSFLELLDMYDTHLIDHLELLQRLVPFLGRNKPLLDRFRRNLLLDRTDNNENINEEKLDNHAILSPSTSPRDSATGNHSNDTDTASDVSTISSGIISSSRPTAPRPTTYNPSYRWIPKSLRNENCPGRDDTCWEVLNDEYVSHPTWASEDNGFLSSNKSKSEEMLHMVEDERYALDIDLCIISDGLSIMEKYLNLITKHPNSQHPKLHLYPENDGCSTSLFTLAIKKVYPRERRKDTAKQLRTRPSEMLPGFVKLLKQKQLDLQKQKLDKARNWKETVAKHYYKFLDYHWESHKSDTRKNLTIQNLVNEIDALWHEQQRQAALHNHQELSRRQLHAESPIIPTMTNSTSKPILSPPQLVYTLGDSSVIHDVLGLMRISSSHQFQYNNKGTKAIERFLTEYLPFFLGLPSGYGLDEHGLADFGSSMGMDDTFATVKTRSQGHQRRQRVLPHRSPQKLVALDQRLFIGSTNWYCMTRYFQMIYAALAHMKSIDQQYEKSPKETKRKISAPLDLALETKTVSSVTVDLAHGYYGPALEIMKAFIRGDLEQIDLEEGVRYLFGVEAYVAFNIGKTLPYLIRQVHQIMTSPTLDPLFNTFKKYQPCRLEDMHSVLEYRYDIDSILEPDDNRFIMAIDGHAQQLSLQILGQHEAILPKNIRNYIEYVTSYQQRKRKTVGVKRKSMSKVFLNRNLEPEGGRAPSKIFLESNLKSKIDPRTYQISFVNETEDVFVRQVINTRKRKFGETDGQDEDTGGGESQ